MKLTVNMGAPEATPNTVKFAEQVDENDFLAAAQIGRLYIPKATLRAQGYKGGTLKVTVEEVA